MPLGGLVLALGVGWSLIGARLFAAITLSAVLPQASIISILALGEMMVLLVGGLDLSLGAIAILSAVVMAQLSGEYGMASALALGAGISVGAACGFLNGAASGFLRLPSVVVTLASFIVFDALTFIYPRESAGETVSVEAKAPLLSSIGRTFGLGEAVFSYAVVVAVLVALFLAYALNLTAWGKHLTAVGEDGEAARLAGLSPALLRLGAFVAAGVLAALAAWAIVGRLERVVTTSSLDIMLPALAAALVGGATPSAGRPSVLGVLIAAVSVTFLVVSLRIGDVEPHLARLVLAVVILLMVVLDASLRREWKRERQP